MVAVRGHHNLAQVLGEVEEAVQVKAARMLDLGALVVQVMVVTEK
jgi:hypothetical protein